MSHPFCGSEVACPPSPAQKFPNHGWNGWNGKAVYIRTKIDDSVTHRVACGDAIKMWNLSAGTRFLLIEDLEGRITQHVGGEITFFEKSNNEWPFNKPEWFINGQPAAGFALNYGPNGNLLGTSPGRIAHSKIYINRYTKNRDFADNETPLEYNHWVHFFAHEIGHAFGLADHPNDNINSVMSYQSQGIWLFGPSWEDTQGIARIYGLESLPVQPQDLEGIQNIESIWFYDRYDRLLAYRHRSLWGFFSTLFLGRSINTLTVLQAYESYMVKAKQPGQLGFGRFSLPVLPGQHFRWVYK